MERKAGCREATDLNKPSAAHLGSFYSWTLYGYGRTRKPMSEVGYPCRDLDILVRKCYGYIYS
jgi:hypothetical protein